MAENILLQIDLLQFLNKVRLPLEVEKKTQAVLYEKFQDRFPCIKKEYHLSDEDIPDFFVAGICIELKIKGSKVEIYRQLERYSLNEEVKVIVLMTNKAMALPKEINGKPAILINLGKAWL